MTRARVKAFEAGYPEIRAEIEYFFAVQHLNNGSLEAARACAMRMINAEPQEHQAPAARSRTLNLAELKLRGYDVLSVLAAREQRNIERAEFLRLGLEQLGCSTEHDHYVECVTLTNLAVACSQSSNKDLHDFVKMRVERMQFASFTKKYAFEIYRAIGLGSAMHGDHLGALRLLRHSADVAPSTSSKIKALVDRSLLAREFGENLSADEEAEYALRLSKQVDWKAEKGRELYALLGLAQALVSRNVTEARRSFALYGVCKRDIGFLNQGKVDGGIIGREFQVDAELSQAEGNLERAVRLNCDALQRFKEVGHGYSAADVAVSLYRLTGEMSYLDFAALQAQNIPHSHLARRVRALRESALVTSA